jgi:hypothetical protein
LFHQEIKLSVKFKSKAYFIIGVCLFFISNSLVNGQGIGQPSSNPIAYLVNEHNNSIYQKDYPINIIRPFYKYNFPHAINISYTSLNFYNSGFNNLHNNGAIIAYPKLSNYLSYSFSYYNNFVYVRFSPLLQKNNSPVSLPLINGNFSYLNDKKADISLKVDSQFLSQSTFALHYNGLGFGISNESMWFGPGFHSSLSMSNNAPGFKHYFIGTLKQQRIAQFGFNFRYFVSERNNDQSSFYHTSLASTITYYNNPTITVGFNRTYLSGGVDKIIWSMEDAAKLVFEPLFGESKKNLKYVGQYEGEPDYWDPWDQLLVGFVNIYFPQPKAHFYFELGTDDSRANLSDLKAHWDHAIGYIIGLNKFGILGNSSVFFSLEFMSNKNTSNTLNPLFYRGDWDTPNFYNRRLYLHSSNEGRRWGAHSGSDSDDKIIMLGYIKDDFSIISSYNIERHGVVSQNYPEKKHEVILRFSKQKNHIVYTLYLENEKIYNYNFELNSNPEVSNVIGLGIQYNLGIDK